MEWRHVDSILQREIGRRAVGEKFIEAGGFLEGHFPGRPLQPGVLTLEDIIEEILGEIQDEYDEEEELLYQQVGEGEYIFQGRIDLDDFNEIMNSQLAKDDADTLSGLIYSRIGRVPKGGESVQADDLLLTVEQVSGRRIRKVRARRIPTTLANGEEPNHANG